MPAQVIGEIDWNLSIDKQWQRTYTVDWLVETANPLDGPAIAANASGIVAPGSPWTLGNDFDAWAFCMPTKTVKRYQAKRGDPHRWWKVSQTFTTNTETIDRCWDQQFDNPLLEPPKLSGNFAKYYKEARFDRFGKGIQNTAFERFTGKETEIIDANPKVSITMNFGVLPIVLYTEYMNNTVNDSSLWGFPQKTISLTDCTWEEKWYGTCVKYYTVTYDFEIRDEGWELGPFLNEGHKHLRNGGDSDNPDHFVLNTDGLDERNVKMRALDEDGNYLAPGADPIKLVFQTHSPENYLALGIPALL